MIVFVCFPLFFLTIFVFFLALLHPHRPDVETPGLALAAGKDFILASHLQYVLEPGSYSLTGTLNNSLPPHPPLPVINIAGFCPSRPVRCEDIALLLVPGGLPLPRSLNQAVQETGDQSVIARVESALCQLMAASFERGVL